MLFMQHLHLRRVAKPSVLVGLYCKVSWRRAGRWNLVITWSLFFWSIISAYTIHVSSQYNSSRIADRKRRRSMAAVMHTLGSLNSSNQASSPQSSATRRTPQSLLHCACSAQSAQEQKSLNPLWTPDNRFVIQSPTKTFELAASSRDERDCVEGIVITFETRLVSRSADWIGSFLGLCSKTWDDGGETFFI